MGKKESYNLIWLILITTLSACTESSSPDNGSDIDLYASYIHPDFTQFGESDPKLKVGKEAEPQTEKHSLHGENQPGSL